jgi:ABC-type nitrate/sulfonate/bicarbonate transport system ATPase subunit
LRYPHRAVPVLNGLDFEVQTGEVVALVGPSGGGKSSLLRVIAGLERLDAGAVDIFVDGRSSNGAPPLVAPPGIAFQDPLLLPWLTVSENVALGRGYRAHRHVDAATVTDLLHQFGLVDVRHAYPSELSGGQAQRASVARAMAVRPAVLLLDEPFGAVDPATRASLQEWLRTVVREWALTVVIVTHDISEAITLANRIAVIDGSGKVGCEFDTMHADVGLAAAVVASFAGRPLAPESRARPRSATAPVAAPGGQMPASWATNFRRPDGLNVPA